MAQNWDKFGFVIATFFFANFFGDFFKKFYRIVQNFESTSSFAYVRDM